MRSLLTRRGLIAIIIVGVGLRLWVMTSHLGTLSADEAYTGLQARAILDGRFPVVIDGMTYTAVFESYLFAPFVALFGLHVVPLKFLSTLGWVTAAVFTGAAVRRLAPPHLGRLASAMVWLAPGAILVLTTRAYVGYSTGVAAVAATFWAATRLADEARNGRAPTAWRSALVGGLGGLAVYCHPMFATVALPMLAVIAWQQRRRLKQWWLPGATAAVAVNLPFLVWNAVNEWPSLEQPADATESAPARLSRFFTGLLPRVLGLRTGDGTWVHGRLPGVVLYVALVMLVAWGCVVAVRRHGASGAVLVAPLVLAWPAMSMLSNLSFVADGRYGVITFPFVIAALVCGLGDLAARWPASRVLAVTLGMWVLLFTVPWVTREAGRDLGDPNAHVQRVIDTLEAEGVTRVLGTYWWVLPIDLISDGHILTGTVGHPDVILLPRTQASVETTPDDRLAYVFAPDAYAPELLRLAEDRYDLRRVAGAVVLIPRP